MSVLAKMLPSPQFLSSNISITIHAGHLLKVLSKVGNWIEVPSHTGTFLPLITLVTRGMLPLSSLVARELIAKRGAVGYENGSKSNRRRVCQRWASAMRVLVEFLN